MQREIEELHCPATFISLNRTRTSHPIGDLVSLTSILNMAFINQNKVFFWTWTSFRQSHCGLYPRMAATTTTTKYVSDLFQDINITFDIYYLWNRSRGSAVGIATGYGLDDWGVGVRVPVGSRISTSPNRPDRLCGSPNLLSNAYRGLVLRG
jgi:hypothetical protein